MTAAAVLALAAGLHPAGAGTATPTDSVVTLVEMFRRHDPDARRVAEAWLTRVRPEDFDRRNNFLFALGDLDDSESLIVLRGMAGSDNPYAGQFAVLGLAKRREPEAETALTDRMLATGGDGYVGGIARVQLVQRGTPGAARAILRWAAARRDIRDDAAAVLHGWLAAHGSATMEVLGRLAADPDPAVAGLARGFLDRLPLTRTACGLPGAPGEGAAADGAGSIEVLRAWREFVWQGIAQVGPRPQNVYVRLRARRPVYPWALALAEEPPATGVARRRGSASPSPVTRAYRLTRAPIWDAVPGRRHVPWLEPGDIAIVSNTFYQTYYFVSILGEGAPTRPLAAGEGELVVFRGEEKQAIRFRIEPARVPPGGPPPVP